MTRGNSVLHPFFTCFSCIMSCNVSFGVSLTFWYSLVHRHQQQEQCGKKEGFYKPVIKAIHPVSQYEWHISAWNPVVCIHTLPPFANKKREPPWVLWAVKRQIKNTKVLTVNLVQYFMLFYWSWSLTTCGSEMYGEERRSSCFSSVLIFISIRVKYPIPMPMPMCWHAYFIWWIYANLKVKVRNNLDGNWKQFGWKLETIWMEIGNNLDGNWKQFGWKLETKQ